MAQIKQTIELLTKILQSNGATKIKPEIFRLAKFDREEATELMWKLLFEMIYYLRFNKIDDITVKAYSQLTPEELCVYVKTEMKMRGFCSRSFHELDNEMNSGSRELLLAFGWLMCRSQLIYKFMDNCCSSLQSQQENIDQLEGDRDLAAPRFNSIKDRVKYMMWLNGKLRMNLRSLYMLQQQKGTLTQAIESATVGVSTNPAKRNNLTTLEVMMIRNPELLKHNLKLLDTDNNRLEDLLSWSDHDDLFWKWMESVLDSKVASQGLIEEVSDMITPRTTAVKQTLDNKLMLVETVRKYESIVEHLEEDLFTQTGSHTRDDIDSLLASIDAEIALHSTQLFFESKQAAESTTPVARIKPVQRQTMVETSASEAEQEITKIEYELNHLQDLVERLQKDIEYKQYQYKDEVSSLSSGMEDIMTGTMTFTNNHPHH